MGLILRRRQFFFWNEGDNFGAAACATQVLSCSALQLQPNEIRKRMKRRIFCTIFLWFQNLYIQLNKNLMGYTQTADWRVSPIDGLNKSGRLEQVSWHWTWFLLLLSCQKVQRTSVCSIGWCSAAWCSTCLAEGLMKPWVLMPMVL